MRFIFSNRVLWSLWTLFFTVGRISAEPIQHNTPLQVNLGFRGAVELTFSSAQGVYYQVDFSTDLVNWDPEGYSVKGTGGVMKVLASSRNRQTAYYRLRNNGDPANAAPAGPVGPVGPQGVAGPVGGIGPQGPVGIQGTPGIQGIQGVVGLQGPVGPQGIPGAGSSEGIQGPPGPAGPQGVMGPQGVQGPVGPSSAPTGGVAGQVLIKKSNTDFDSEWKSLTTADLVDSTSTGIALLTSASVGAQRDILQAANRTASLRDDFARYPDGTVFTHLAQAPDFGGLTNWRITAGNSGPAGHPAVKNDPILGRGLVGQSNGLYYMANSLSEPIRSFSMELSNKSTGTPGFHNGLTFGFASSDLVPANNTIGLPVGMIHLRIARGIIGNSITNQAAAVFDDLIPDGETTPNQPWFKDSATAGLAMNVRYTLRITFEEDAMVFTMNGRTLRWRDSRISPTHFKSFFFETAGPTNYEDVWVIHRIAVNDDTQMSEIDGHRGDFPGALAKSTVLDWPRKQRHALTGEAASFSNGGVPSNAAHAVADYYYSEKGLVVRPWSGNFGDLVATLGRRSTDQSLSPAGNDQLWHQTGLPVLLNIGDWFESTIALEFPNTRSKQFKFRTAAGIIPDLTMPAFSNSGIGVMRIMQCRTLTDQNFVQIELEVVTNSDTGTVKKWIRRYHGTESGTNRNLNMMFTGSEVGDAVINGSTDHIFIRKP